MRHIDNFMETIFRRLPMRFVFGVGSLGLGFANIVDQTGGVARIMVNVVGVHPTLHVIMMGALALSGAVLLIWPWTTNRGPEALYALYMMYAIVVVLATLWNAGINPSESAAALFIKTLFVYFPLIWLLIRELTWPE